MKNQLDALWSEKYRPTTIDQYVFQSDTDKQCILDMIENRTIPNLLLSGVCGSGKTTLARILIDALLVEKCDVLEINASDDNNVETIRTKIKSFVTTFAMGDFKIVYLEEADYLTPAAQGILRVLMQDYTDSVRFLLTCNYDSKMTPALKSRCSHFHFKASNINDITEYACKVLLAEKVKLNLTLIDEIVAAGYPDVRMIINTLQRYTIKGVLVRPSSANSATDYKFQLIDLIAKDNWMDIRKVACANVLQEEWNDVYRFLYENLDKAPKFKKMEKWEQGIVTIADHLDKHERSSDPEINFAACAISLSQI